MLICFRYLYTDEVKLSSISQAFRLLQVTKRCGPKALIDEVFEYIYDNINGRNVVAIAEVAHEYKHKRTSSKAISYIINQAPTTLPDKSFGKLCLRCLEKVIKSSDLPVNEMTIYSAVQFWAEQECFRLKIDVTEANLKKVLGNVLYCVRFPLINFQSINRDFSIFKALSDSEKKSLYQYHTGKVQMLPHYLNNTKRKFDELNRQTSPGFVTPPMSRASNISEASNESCKTVPSTASGKKSVTWSIKSHDSSEGQSFFHKVLRFKSLSGPWTMTHPETLTFKCSRAVVLCGLMMFAAYGSDEEYKLDITVTSEEEILLHDKSAVRNFEKKPKEVLFHNDVPISPGVEYGIKVSMTEKPTYIGVLGQKHVDVNNTTFTFIDKANDITRGQLPGLLFKSLLNHDI